MAGRLAKRPKIGSVPASIALSMRWQGGAAISDLVTSEERAAIDAYIERHGVTLCEPSTYTPEDETRTGLSWQIINARRINARWSARQKLFSEWARARRRFVTADSSAPVENRHRLGVDVQIGGGK